MSEDRQNSWGRRSLGKFGISRQESTAFWDKIKDIPKPFVVRQPGPYWYGLST